MKFGHRKICLGNILQAIAESLSGCYFNARYLDAKPYLIADFSPKYDVHNLTLAKSHPFWFLFSVSPANQRHSFLADFLQSFQVNRSTFWPKIILFRGTSISVSNYLRSRVLLSKLNISLLNVAIKLEL